MNLYSVSYKVTRYTPRKILNFEKENKIMEKLTFNSIDKAFHGQLSLIIEIAKQRAEKRNFDHGYEWAKPYLQRFVGWYAYHSVKEFKTEEAYNVGIGKLADECWAGHDQGVAIRDYCEEHNISLWIRNVDELITPLEEESVKKRKEAYAKIIKLGLAKN